MGEEHPPGCRCGHHVFSTVVGFGLRVVPRAPFRVRLGPDPGTLDVEHDAPDGDRFARVITDGAGGFRSKLDERTGSLHDVLDIEGGPPTADAWHVDAPGLRFPLPAGYSLHSVPAGAPSPFDLVGPGGTLLYAQRPRRVPELDAMVGRGQHEAKRGRSWIEVEYEHEGRRWWQRHQVVRESVVFTSQAPIGQTGEARAVLAALLEALVVG